MNPYPDDDDGAVLAELKAMGVDMTTPLVVEFPVSAPNEDAANRILAAMLAEGYECRVEYDDGEELEPEDEPLVGPSWSVLATVRMIPAYDELIRVQADLDRIAEPLDGYSDGWGVLIDS
jgi:hypothetical protein